MQGAYMHIALSLLDLILNVTLATTSGGSLRLKIDQVGNVDDNHNLTYRSGMVRSSVESDRCYDIQ